jgi:hypothetical protein
MGEGLENGAKKFWMMARKVQTKARVQPATGAEEPVHAAEAERASERMCPKVKEKAPCLRAQNEARTERATGMLAK